MSSPAWLANCMAISRSALALRCLSWASFAVLVWEIRRSAACRSEIAFSARLTACATTGDCEYLVSSMAAA